jgi:hypothetical protein
VPRRKQADIIIIEIGPACGPETEENDLAYMGIDDS